MKKAQLSTALSKAQQKPWRPLFDVVDPVLDHAYLTLQAGCMPEGWDLYESRWRLPGWAVKPPFLPPELEWTGEPFQGKTLLLYYEQGFGDMFQFVRYASLAKSRGGQVLLSCSHLQADVLATCPGIDDVIPVIHGQPTALPGFDLHLPVCSLPRIFQTDLHSIPAPIPYLDVPSWVPNRATICEILDRPQRGLRIGCAWAGSPGHAHDGLRSIPPGAFAALEAVQGCEWFSFQHGKEGPGPFPGITALAPLISNFSDTALALTFMDVVVTVDTSLAHLAGAMGIPVLLLLSVPCDWRWLLDRSDSPWYPTMRLFRQPRLGDWPAVIQEAINFVGSCQLDMERV